MLLCTLAAARRCLARIVAALVLMTVVPAAAVLAQAPPTDPPAAPAGFVTAAQAPGERGGFSSFLHDVGHDYVNIFSVSNAKFVSMGGAVTVAIYMEDDALSPGAEPTPTLYKAGATYGNPSFQVPLALGWWIAGHAAGSSRAASAGRDLLRAQINAASVTYAIKYAVGRTRPNGDPRSFPSGHSSATFATAAVLQQHYGWKLGLPFYALAGYTAVERVYDLKHWPSDVAFGAVVGMMSGRTVTVRFRNQRVAIEPQPLPGGGMVRLRVSQ
jgi:hypothetical protein